MLSTSPSSSALTPLALPLSFLSLLPSALAAAEPRQAVWSTSAFGPDGPWNAVEVSLGAQPPIALFPGRMFHTFVTTSDYCAINNSVPHCASGTYLKDKAVMAGSSTTGSAKKIDFKPPTQQLNAGIEARGSANLYLDTIDLQFSGGVIQNHSVALIETESQMLAYPGGGLYPVFTGCLSIGSPDSRQVFTGGGSRPDVNATMIPWGLQAAGTIPSTSFGLHYGSASPSAKIPGSLLFGGYDSNRVVGPALSLTGDLWKAVTLRDISLRTIRGTSPFVAQPAPNTTVLPNLLSTGNSTMPPSGLPVLLDPCSPYFTLPKSTCDAIASHLPVTYNASLGLYLWNTTSPYYRAITSSSSTLAFTFMGATNTDSLTIHVPFPHLNLTLSPPFVSNPAGVPYFPCFTGGVGAYALGRAFFQDAFLGANWEKGKVWLAQAPGPNVPASVEVVAVQAGQEAIEAGGNGWETSWEGFWKGLTGEEVAALEDDGSRGRNGQQGGNGTSAGAAVEQGGGLSTGATIGIGVGAALGAIVVVAAVGLFWWRRRARRSGSLPGEGVAVTPATETTTVVERRYGELDASGPGATEVPGHMAPMVYEMPTDQGRGQNGWGWQPR
ncbi:aspartic peptidase domain-containing protein [Staphylotrichum tortipilum]|uniref:Aspartic peptidase domain-containing protein n=1 Tax=Staphylotrichum tortipilum TaxID=2831512 RepID=A0AAN6ME58_9PEZI|nr:aspartic peptidase domain-containing protein [Staphylotrichum longicolle]